MGDVCTVGLSYWIKFCRFFSYFHSGGFGGCRVAFALRPMLAELSAISVPSSLTLIKVQEQLDAEGNPLSDRVVTSSQKLITNLDWYANACKKQKEAEGLPK